MKKRDVCIVSKKNSVFCRLELQTASLVNFLISFSFLAVFSVIHIK